jgi:GGDEF domain-containing protein
VCEKVAQILAVMAEPPDADSSVLTMPSCSIGIACYPADGEDADTLLSHADDDMYRIKRQRSVAG